MELPLIALSLSATRATQLYVVLQEEARDGQPERRYSTVIGVQASTTPKTYTLPLKDFRLVDTTGTATGAEFLNLDRVSTLVIGDLEVLNGQQPGANNVYIDEVQLFGAKGN